MRVLWKWEVTRPNRVAFHLSKIQMYLQSLFPYYIHTVSVFFEKNDAQFIRLFLKIIWFPSGTWWDLIFYFHSDHIFICYVTLGLIIYTYLFLTFEISWDNYVSSGLFLLTNYKNYKILSRWNGQFFRWLILFFLINFIIDKICNEQMIRPIKYINTATYSIYT